MLLLTHAFSLKLVKQQQQKHELKSIKIQFTFSQFIVQLTIRY